MITVMGYNANELIAYQLKHNLEQRANTDVRSNMKITATGDHEDFATLLATEMRIIKK